jgi:hypothetical protein
LTAESERCATLHKAASKAVKRLLDAGVASFCARVQNYLGDVGEIGRFGIQLADGEREVARLGLWRGDDATSVLHTALGGGERARVQLALAMAMGAANTSSLAIYVVEDRSMGAVMLAAMLDAVGAAVMGARDQGVPMQVFVTTTTEPVESVWLDHWTVVRLGDAVEVGEVGEVGDAAITSIDPVAAKDADDVYLVD